MSRYESLQDPPPELGPAIRNNYFHGKLMDAYHFQMETDYHNAKRWLFRSCCRRGRRSRRRCTVVALRMNP